MKPRFIYRITFASVYFTRAKRKGKGEGSNGLALKTPCERIVSIHRYTRYDILLEPEDKIRRMEGVRGRYLLNGDVNNADDSTSDSISRSIARPVSGVSVLPRTIEARIDSVPGGTGKGYKTYRCLVLSDASSVDATKQIATYTYIPLFAGKSVARRMRIRAPVAKISVHSSPAIPSERANYTRIHEREA